MQNRNTPGSDRRSDSRTGNPNPAGSHREPEFGDEDRFVDADPPRANPARSGTTHGAAGIGTTHGDRKTGAGITSGTREARDPKDNELGGRHGATRTPVEDRAAPGPGSEFVRDSQTFRSMKSWQPWALVAAAVAFVIIALMVF